ncbi:uncharacterized protein LOC116996705 [Catharus ustulatus]|uniref:uncharacterized protein LOC116996705 n=1 Tax=Catharus ustulatus TaxID=91951 RepID=UPI00140D929C|nr:uncharacterized protein LOC116996705 [Catharus ustulatus]
MAEAKQRAAPREGAREIAPGNGPEQEDKQDMGSSSNSCQKSTAQVVQALVQALLQIKQSCLEPPGLTEETLPKVSVATKRPGEHLEHDKSKRVRKEESEPGPVEVTQQSCKGQLNKDPKLALEEPSEERKAKGSPQANTKGYLDPELLGDAQERDALIPNGHRAGHFHQEKVASPPGEKKLFFPPRKPDLKRKEMESPEKSPRKKKREDKGDTPRKKKE